MKKPEYHQKFTGTLTSDDGTTRWFIQGAYGRSDGLPAIEAADGSLHWYVENPKRGGFGQRGSVEHRDDGPAIIRANGDKLWYRFGKLHRDDDLPAIELADGVKKWFTNGNFVRLEFSKAVLEGCS